MKLKTIILTTLLLTAFGASIAATSILASTPNLSTVDLSFDFQPIQGWLSPNGDGDPLPGGGIPTPT